MKKLLIIGFYELKDQLVNIKECFEEYYYSVISYPLFRWAYDANDRKDDYQTHLHQFLVKEKPDIILWWFIDVPLDVFKFIKRNHASIYYIIFNSDDPMNINSDTLEKCKIFDQVVTSCAHNISKYKLYSGIKNVIFNPQGYNPAYFHSLSSEEIEEYGDELTKYECDISIYCFQLLTDPFYKDQWIPRKQLLDDISQYAKSNNKVFKVYGPPALREYYPEHYVTDPPYIDIIKIYNRSKINIVTHQTCKKKLFIGLHEMRIMGSGGLLFVDNTKGMDDIFKDGENCIVMKKTGYIQQIDDILTNYDPMETIRYSAHQLSKEYTWEKWVEKVHISISKDLFSEDSYKSLYDRVLPDEETIQNGYNNSYWEYWLREGLAEKQVCYSFVVPKLFNFEEYAQMMNINSKDPRVLYNHWYMNGKNPDYMNKGDSKGSMLNSEKLNLTMGDMFRVLASMDKIHSHGSIDEGLIELDKLARDNPRLKVNEILEYYLSTQ